MKLFRSWATILSLIAACGSSVYGQQTTIFRNTGDTSFENPANWNNGVPTAGVSAYVVPNGIGDPTGAFLVTQGGASNIVIVASTNHTSANFFVTNDVGETLPVGSVTLTFTAGTNYAISNNVGVQDGETLNYSGALTIGGALNVGNTDGGTFNLTHGGIDLTNGFGIDVGAGASVGTVTQSGGSTVTVGGEVDIENGRYTLNDTSTLQTTDGAFVALGGGTGGAGTLTLNASSDVTLGDGTVLEAGINAGEIGNIVQNGGSLVAAGTSLAIIGDGGTGTYTLSGGTADFQDGLAAGLQAGSTGSINQSGGTLTVEGASLLVGLDGTASYTMSGGTATFSNGITVGALGSVSQTGGTITIAGGTLDLSTVGSSYSLDGGTLRVADGTLVGTTGQGAFNLGGGTLQVTTAGVFTDGLDGTLTGQTVIDAATTPGVTDVTLAGDLHGSGGLTFVGGAGTTFDFTGDTAYTGMTSVVSGTLNASQDNIGNSSAYNIGSAGTLNLALNPGGLAFQGALLGAGAFNVNFAADGDPLLLKNSSGFTGTINLGGSDGTLQVFGGNFAAINGNGSGVTIGGIPLIPTAGTPTSGVVTIDNSNYTGPTTISQNFTLNANTLGGTVANNGSLFANGSGALVNNGTLGLSKTSAVGSTFNINGALTANANSAIVIRASGIGATPVADSIVATGPGTISSDSTIRVTGSGNITAPIAIVTADGGLTIAPGALPKLKTGLLFQATITYDAGTDSIDLTAVQNSLGSFALTPNEAATAVPIDLASANPGNLTPGQTNALNQILLPLNNLPSSEQIAKALEQLSPQSLQYARNIAFENTTFLVQKLNSFDADLRSGYGGLDDRAISITSPMFNSGLGRSMQSLLASNDGTFHEPAPNGVNYYPEEGSPSAGGGSISSSSSESSSARASAASSSPAWDSSSQVISDSPNPYLVHQDPSRLDAPAFSEFISGDVILADLNQDHTGIYSPSTSASYTAGSVTGGVAFRMNSHLAAGVLMDYTHTDARTDEYGSKTKIDSYSPGLFATYFDHGFYANGLFSFGYNDYSNTRDVGIVGKDASSDPSGQQYVGSLDAGYDFHPDKNWVVGPTLGLTYTHLDIDSIHETGAGAADLDVQDQSADSFRSRLGGHVIYQTNVGNVLLQPTFSAMWQHEFLADSDGITSTFSEFSNTPFTINTADPTRDSALIGLGLTATLSNSINLYLNYYADVGFGDYFAQSIVGGFKTRF